MAGEGIGTSTATALPTALGALHQRLLRDHSLQFEFTAIAPPKPSTPPGWLQWLGNLLAHGLGPLLPVLKVVFWVGIAAGLALLAWLLLREILAVRWARRRRPRPARLTPADWAPDARKARALLENADRLAAQGRFDLAVRLILHRSIEDIDAHRPRLVRPAQTARDIATLAALPQTARAAFTRMAAVVEYSAFAGQPVGRDAFDQCRSAYETFAFAGVWR